jgi:cell division protein FtsW (lipid II flippase)
MLLAALFMILFSIALTIAPAARVHSWAVDLRWTHWIGTGAWLVAFATIHLGSRRTMVVQDPYLLPIAAFLTGWGLMTIYRLLPNFGLRQSIWLLVAGAVFTLALRLPPSLNFLRRYKYLWLFGGLVLTGLTLFFGTNPVGVGPQLWLGCCGIYFQPSEPLKLLLIVYLSAYLAERTIPGDPQAAIQIGKWLTPFLVPTLVMVGLALALLVVQRDLGTATIFIFLYTTLIYLATGRRRIPVLSALFLSMIGLVGYLAFDLVRLRIEAWLNPWLDPSGRSFQIVQSLLAVANGGVPGRGPGMGSPGLVPVAHSDFIFVAISEESGLLGVVALLGVLALLVHRGLRAAIYARNNFQRYLAAGIIAYLVGQSILIIGGNIRLLPLTGVTLPLVSYGGSSLLISILSLFILMRISENTEIQPYPLPAPKPYLQLGGLLFAGLAAIAILAGWWSVYRSADLLARQDNPRRAIDERFVRRGSLLDRANQALATTTGEAGSYTRRYDLTGLGPVLGYSQFQFGQAGLEANLDDYLSGRRGHPASTIWWYHLLYGQTPPGLDVRLALDTTLQNATDELLRNHTGAVVLLDATSGEILAMASHPGYDANQLAETWSELITDARSPLLNRATQGLYQAGSAFAPFLLAASYDHGYTLPPAPDQLSLRMDGLLLTCAVDPGSERTWEAILSAGCPYPIGQLVEQLLGAEPHLVADSLFAFGFFQTPAIRMVTAATPYQDRDTDPLRIGLGQGFSRVTPLQMALAAAALSNDGIVPVPRIALSVNVPPSGWVVLSPTGESQTAIGAIAAERTTRLLAAPELPYWQVLASAHDGAHIIHWYLAGTLESWDGSPLALALVLEDDNPVLAAEIGAQILRAALTLP